MGVFVFIGAKPRTDFLPAELARDDKGFALTGSAVAKLESWKEQRLPEALETSLPGYLQVAIAAAVLPSGWLLQLVTGLWRSAASTTC